MNAGKPGGQAVFQSFVFCGDGFKGRGGRNVEKVKMLDRHTMATG